MEAAALDAYQRDVAQNSTADLTSIAINKKLSDDNLQIATRKVWHELVGRDGKSYYWNTITNGILKTVVYQLCGYLIVFDYVCRNHLESPS